MSTLYRKMRAILMYDLPSVEKDDVVVYNRFIKDIKKCGFYMLQFSVYVKSLTNQEDYNRLLNRIKKFIPRKGSIVIIRLTEKQYSDMVYLNGESNTFDSIVGSKNIVMIGGNEDGT